jgi:hypothetical protein
MKMRKVDKSVEAGQDQQAKNDTKKGKRLSQAVLYSVEHIDLLPDWARLTPAAVAMINGHSMATYWRRVAAGEIPKPTRQFGRSVSNTVGEIRNLGRKEA